MATSPHLTGKLRGALGADAGEELVGIVDKAATDIAELRADVAELRHEVHIGFARVDQGMVAMKSELQVDLVAQTSSLRNDLTAQMSSMHTDLAENIALVKSDLMKWSFMFWVGAVAAIALLARALRP